MNYIVLALLAVNSNIIIKMKIIFDIYISFIGFGEKQPAQQASLATIKPDHAAAPAAVNQESG